MSNVELKIVYSIKEIQDEKIVDPSPVHVSGMNGNGRCDLDGTFDTRELALQFLQDLVNIHKVPLYRVEGLIIIDMVQQA